jgi:hypothetical protein
LQIDNGETREEEAQNVMIQKPAEREAQRVQANREELSAFRLFSGEYQSSFYL